MKAIINPRNRIEYGFISALSWVFRTLPLRWARWFAAVIAWKISHLAGIRRKVALDNLRKAFPEKQERDLRRIYHRCWRHFVSVGAELARLPSIDEAFIQRWTDIESKTDIDTALQNGKGGIVVSGHFGNWELVGGCMARIGYPVTYVVTSQSNPLVENWLNRMRKSVNIEIIKRKDAIRGILGALKRNRIVAILCDQDAGKSGLFVPFFNQLASTPRGPALFHLKTGTPIIFMSAPCQPDGTYQAIFEEMYFDDLTGNRESDEILIMAQITARLEKEIRRFPEQWLWLHRRWKTVQNDALRTD